MIYSKNHSQKKGLSYMKSKSKPPIKTATNNNNDKVNIDNRPPLPYHNLTTSVPELLCIFCSKDNN